MESNEIYEKINKDVLEYLPACYSSALNTKEGSIFYDIVTSSVKALKKNNYIK